MKYFTFLTLTCVILLDGAVSSASSNNRNPRLTYNVLDECGSGDYVIESYDESRFPWHALVYYYVTVICTASIITPYHVITTAKCLTDKTVKYIDGITVMAHKRYYHLDHNGQEAKVKNLFIHPNYTNDVIDSAFIYKNNIAIIELDEPFDFSYESLPVSSICIDWNSTYENLDIASGNQGKVANYWRIPQQGLRIVVMTSGMLRTYNMEFKTKAECSRDFPFYTEDSKFCMRYLRGAPFCSVDIGTGLFIKSDGKKYFLRGIEIAAAPCVDVNNTALFEKISAHLPWIKSTIQKNINIKFYKENKSVSKTGCKLPAHIQYGKFRMANKGDYVPGELVSSSTAIYLLCDGSRVQNWPSSFYCFQKQWYPPISEGIKCKKPGACPSLKTTVSNEVVCKQHGYRVSCDEPANNTIAIVRCQPFYTFEGHRPIYKCQNGAWDYTISTCSPECGRKRVATEILIIGGTVANQTEYPWVVAIYNSKNNNRLECSGTIISRYYVLTAAHCVTNAKGEPNSKDNYKIIGGKYYRDINVKEPDFQQRKVKALHVYEEYKATLRQYSNDIALIELEEAFKLSVGVAPICMDWDTNYEEFDFVDGNEGVVVGWGYTRSGGLPSDVQKKLVVPYRSKIECLKHLPQAYSNEYFSADKICAGHKDNRSSICKGDSGGGLYFKSDNGKFYIRGIASMAVTSQVGCDENNYALYTKVSKYLSWIERKTRKIL